MHTPRRPKKRTFAVDTPASTKRLKKGVLHETSRHTATQISDLPPSVVIAFASGLHLSGNIDSLGFISVLASAPHQSCLYLWEAKPTHLFSCQEFQLPGSGLEFTAELAQLVPTRSPTGFGLAACSPEGELIVFPDILDPVTRVTITIELDIGESCKQMLQVRPDVYVVSTEKDETGVLSGRIIVLSILPGGEVSYRFMQQKQGWTKWSLGLIGIGQDQTKKPPIKRVLSHFNDEPGEDNLLVLTDHNIQWWQVSAKGDELVIDAPVSPRLCEALVHQGKAIFTPEHMNLIDAQRGHGDRLYILFLAALPNSTCKYGIAEFQMTRKSFKCVTINFLKSPVKIQDASNPPTFLVPAQGPNAFIFSSDYVVITLVPTDARESDLLECDKIIGCGACSNGGALFISSTLGIIELVQHPSVPIMGKLQALKEQSLQTKPKYTEELKHTHVQLELLTTSLWDYKNRGQRTSTTLISGLEPLKVIDCNSSITQLSELILNGDEMGIISERDVSLIHKEQINEKQSKHILLLRFLKDFGLIQYLKPETKHLLAQHGQKLSASEKFREIADRFIFISYLNDLLCSSMSVVLTLNHIELGSSSVFNKFYQQVDLLPNLFHELIKEEKKRLSPYSLVETNEREISFEYILCIDQLICETLRAALSYLDTNRPHYFIGKDKFLGWVSSIGLIETLSKQAKMNFRFFNELPKDSQNTYVYDELYVETKTLYELALNQLQYRISFSPDDDKLLAKFEELKKESIHSFLARARYGEALQLAERFHDFETLIYICEGTPYLGEQSQQKISEYSQQYFEQGFPQVLCEWYYAKNQISKLMDQPDSNDLYVRDFLYERQLDSLSWLHDIKLKNFAQCSKTLSKVIIGEENFNERKLLLSIEKLSIMAGEQQPQDETKEDQLRWMIAFQEQIFGEYNEKALGPQELIGEALNQSKYSPQEQHQLAQSILESANLLLSPQDFGVLQEQIDNFESTHL